MVRYRSRLSALSLSAALVTLAVACQTAAPLPPPQDFTLTDHHAQPFTLSSLRGHVVLIFFGYSHCPDVCPTTLSKLSSVSRRLGADRSVMKVVYVSVDPARDTPEVLAADLGFFDLDAVGVTGTKADVDRVVEQFGAKYDIVQTPESAGQYVVNHSTTLYAVDPEGRIRTQFPYEATVDEIVAGVRALRTR
ncbi:MAG: SCO family protein [Vicinamibacterales bacterium]|jgi:protein SCO1/2